MNMQRRLGAEFFGTFWLTFAGCGSAVLAAGFPSLGIGFWALLTSIVAWTLVQRLPKA